MAAFHKPVLLKEAIKGLNIKEDGIYVDATYGGGGHAREILAKLNKKGKLYVFDQDEFSIQNKINDDRLIMIHQNFEYMSNFLRYNHQFKIDGLMADLGVSSFQIDNAERGFSFMKDAKLDMRMDINSSLSAYQIVNNYDLKKLAFIFREYGELKNAKIIARLIVDNREKKTIKTTIELVRLVQHLSPKRVLNKFLARLFQAIRIEVNREFVVLENLLKQTLNFLSVGGRIVIISYHSLEDRMVKNFLKTGNIRGEEKKDFYGNSSRPFNRITKKPTQPTKKEIQNNPRARSAKMRIAEKKDE